MTYTEIATSLCISKQAVLDTERRAFYKILLILLEEVDCDFNELSKAIDIPVNKNKKAFIRLHAYYRRDRSYYVPRKKSVGV